MNGPKLNIVQKTETRSRVIGVKYEMKSQGLMDDDSKSAEQTDVGGAVKKRLRKLIIHSTHGIRVCG